LPTWFQPSQARPAKPQHRIIRRGDELRRIYAREPHGYRAESFRHFGPLRRFDHHRYPSGAPGRDEERGILYASKFTDCCVAEVFFGTGVVSKFNQEGGEYHLASLRVTRPLRLLKLHGPNAAIDAGTTTNIFTEPYDETQPWARHFYDSIDVYGVVDGIAYTASHGGQEALALFERAADALEVLDDRAFSESLTRHIIIQLAHRLHLEVEDL
jgi:hypothetical protein